jgi:toxin ParE1/3/4
MTLGFELHPEARAELFADAERYDEREIGLGERFEVAVRAAIDGGRLTGFLGGLAWLEA